MFKNNFPISRIIGIGLMGITIFLFGILYEEVINLYSYDSYEGDSNARLKEIHYMVIIGEGFLFTIAMGLIMSKKWARLLTIIALFGGLVLWISMVMIPEILNPRAQVSIFTFTLFLITTAFCVGLLLYNKKTIEEFGDEPFQDEYHEAIDGYMLNQPISKL